MLIWDMFKRKNSELRSYNGAAFIIPMSESLWQGHQYRAYAPFNLTNTGTQVFKFVCPFDFLFTAHSAYLDEGDIHAEIYIGSTEAGVWTTVGTHFNLNSLPGSNPAPTAVISTGGTITGGSQRELHMLKTGGGNPQGQEGLLSGQRLVPAGTYYVKLTAQGVASNGIWRMAYEALNSGLL